MEPTSKIIIRKSIYTFLQNYHYLASAIAIVVFPFSASILLSQAITPSSSPLIPTIQTRLRSLFNASGFPPSSQFFSLLNIKLSQTISTSIFSLPFTLSFLLIAKSSIIQVLHYKYPKPPFSSPLSSLYLSLLLTHLCNSFVILSANAAAFSILFFAFNSLDVLGLSSSPNLLLFLSATGAVLYSVILANTLIICNMAMVVAGMENCSGYLAILKACVLIKGRAATALSLALPTSIGLAAIEALFHYRVVRSYHLSDNLNRSIAWEAMLIAYLYSLLILLDTVIACIFFKSCKLDTRSNWEGGYHYQIEFAEETGNSAFTNFKTIEELP
eukprot:TRINITY_DN23897_c0_g1_i1.p1 TRINITY_DN23897_c0_g1~~TRINITY_DN23897_c0_g1_i1.p1  ORF type:complete len:371 (-),score=29.85 TRINITY_DN23897_c0_g1_i1:288-1274(-)